MRDIKGIDCSVIAFFGFQVGTDGKELVYTQLVDWFMELGRRPTHVAVYDANGKGGAKAFAKADATVRKAGFSDVAYFSLIHLLPEKTHLILGAGVSAEFKSNYATPLYEDPQHVHPGDIAITARSAIATIPSEALLGTAKALASILRPSYGIGFHRDLGLGPYFYAMGEEMGLGFDPEDDLEGERIADWGRGLPYAVYRQGFLRDVYPWNFLTEPQLSAPVGGRTLEQWIRADRHRGELQPLTEEMKLWEVKDEDIPEVQKALSAAGRFFNWERFLETLPKQEPWTQEQVLAWAIGDRKPEDVKVLTGKGDELATEDVKKILKKAQGKTAKRKSPRN